MRQRLTPEQNTVAVHQDGAMLVLAGAGSGKTTVVAHRACNLIESGVSPDRMLMLSFSKKAAMEMSERVSSLSSDPASSRNIVTNTFHGFGFSLLRDSPEVCHRRKYTSLLDEADSKAMYRRIARDILKWDIKVEPVDVYFNYWSLIKQDGCNVYDPAFSNRVCDYLQKRFSLPLERAKACVDLFSRYENYKKEDNCCDFDDFVLLPSIALIKNADFREKISNRFDYVTVDEAQDTNLIQYKMIDSISRSHGNLCMVGDDDQSIYSWRGAEINNIRRFIRDYSPITQPLERNFRSTRSIVNAAGSLINCNQSRLGKATFSENAKGDMPCICLFDNDRSMTGDIAKSIESAISSGVPPSDIAVLYRVNRMSLGLESALRSRGIPYHVVGGMSLFERKEIRAILAGVRLAINPSDTTAVTTLAKYMPGVGEATAWKIVTEMRETGKPLPKVNPDVPERLLTLIKGYYFLLLRAVQAGPSDLIDFVTGDQGLRVVTAEKDDDTRNARQINVEIFRRDILAMASANPGQPWLDLINEMHLGQESVVADRSGVTLSTIHRAKGLEWPVVHIAGMSDRFMPFHSPSGKIENLEEERRLGYVALTRSKHSLTAYHADTYLFPGSEPVVTEPSRFISEMDGHLLFNDFRSGDSTSRATAGGGYLSRITQRIR